MTLDSWDIIADVDFDYTNEITFLTKHGKEVKFVKASAQPEIIHCKDCKHSHGGGYPHCNRVTWWNGENDFCSRAERREE